MQQNILLALGVCALLSSCGSDTKIDKKAANENPETNSNNKTQDNTVDEQEPNNSLKQSNTVDLQKTYRGTLGPVGKNNKGDEDWYVFDAGSEKKRLKITLRAPK